MHYFLKMKLNERFKQSKSLLFTSHMSW